MAVKISARFCEKLLVIFQPKINTTTAAKWRIEDHGCIEFLFFFGEFAADLAPAIFFSWKVCFLGMIVLPQPGQGICVPIIESSAERFAPQCGHLKKNSLIIYPFAGSFSTMRRDGSESCRGMFFFWKNRAGLPRCCFLFCFFSLIRENVCFFRRTFRIGRNIIDFPIIRSWNKGSGTYVIHFKNGSLCNIFIFYI